ncbi:MAG: outer membrane beta-barrel protein [Cytophagales bacterium]|nr:outer membrane beta-barrel protein [Cytophagales bacterium]
MTKKLRLFFVAAFFVIAAVCESRAQSIDRGNMIIGGFSQMAGAYSQNLVKNEKGEWVTASTSLGVNFSPRVGFFIVDNFALGLDVPLAYIWAKADGAEESANTFEYGLGGFVRYYFGYDRIMPFVEAGGHYNGMSIQEVGKDKMTSNSYDLKGMGGVAFFLTEGISLDLAATYMFKSAIPEENEVEISSHNYGLQVGFNISF